MSRYLQAGSGFLVSLGVLLLVVSLVLVPASKVMADGGGGNACPGNTPCDQGCHAAQTTCRTLYDCATQADGTCGCNAPPAGCYLCNCYLVTGGGCTCL